MSKYVGKKKKNCGAPSILVGNTLCLCDTSKSPSMLIRKINKTHNISDESTVSNGRDTIKSKENCSSLRLILAWLAVSELSYVALGNLYERHDRST